VIAAGDGLTLGGLLELGAEVGDGWALVAEGVAGGVSATLGALLGELVVTRVRGAGALLGDRSGLALGAELAAGEAGSSSQRTSSALSAAHCCMRVRWLASPPALCTSSQA
jgi:hypothetical protein